MKKKATLNISLCITAFCFCINISEAQFNSRKIEIRPGQQYLNFHVTEINELKKTRIIIDGKVFDEFTLSISQGKPDTIIFLQAMAVASRHA